MDDDLRFKLFMSLAVYVTLTATPALGQWLSDTTYQDARSIVDILTEMRKEQSHDVYFDEFGPRKGLLRLMSRRPGASPLICRELSELRPSQNHDYEDALFAALAVLKESDSIPFLTSCFGTTNESRLFDAWLPAWSKHCRYLVTDTGEYYQHWIWIEDASKWATFMSRLYDKARTDDERYAIVTSCADTLFSPAASELMRRAYDRDRQDERILFVAANYLATYGLGGGEPRKVILGERGNSLDHSIAVVQSRIGDLASVEELSAVMRDESNSTPLRQLALDRVRDITWRWDLRTAEDVSAWVAEHKNDNRSEWLCEAINLWTNHPDRFTAEFAPRLLGIPVSGADDMHLMVAAAGACPEMRSSIVRALIRSYDPFCDPEYREVLNAILECWPDDIASDSIQSLSFLGIVDKTGIDGRWANYVKHYSSSAFGI